MKASQALFAIADTETTGLERAKGDELVEIGAWCWRYRDGLRGDPFETYVNPGRAIPAMASAVHHITARDVANAPPPALAKEEFRRFVVRYGPDSADALACHNAEFDREFLPDCGLLFLCTKRLAQHVVPDAPAHNNQVLRYHFGGVDLDLRGKAPHRAIADVIVTAFNLDHIFAAYFAAGHPDDLGAMIAFAESPIVFPSLPFGKHRGEPIAGVPEDYLRWMLRQGDLGADVVHTARVELRRRGRAA